MTIYQSATPPPAPKRAWWKRPIVWVLTLVVGAVGVYLTDVVRAYLEARGAPAVEVGERLADPDPIAVVDIRRITNPDIAGDFVVPAGTTNLTELDRALVAWQQTGASPVAALDKVGAIGVETSVWEITLEGLRTSAVEVVDMRVAFDGACTDPIGGAVLMDNQSAGATDKIVLEVAVDKPGSPFLVLNTDETFFTTRKITLPKGEKNVITIAAKSAGPFCKYRLELQYLADGKRDTMLISAPGGQPFAVTGAAAPGAYEFVYLSALRGCDLARVTGEAYADIKENGGCP